MDKLQNGVKACRLFIGLPEEDLNELCSIAMYAKFKRGEVIFCDGDAGEGFYIVISGRVKIYKLGTDGREQILHFVHNGDPFGEITLFAGTAYPAFAKAVSDVEALFFRRDDFKALVERNPQLSLNMIAIMSFHLRRFAALIEDLSLKDVPARVAQYLLNLAAKGGREKDGAVEIELDMSKTELAQRLGTISETISRTLGKMKSSGIIDTNGKRVIILDMDMLEEVASGIGK
ncbi:MAG: Crp/Fnr family transcriptional regulator [Firmicutes bacterium]|nr:Crp/Fnr family transcriptional regulator [Bacillota bacterium]